MLSYEENETLAAKIEALCEKHGLFTLQKVLRPGQAKQQFPEAAMTDSVQIYQVRSLSDSAPHTAHWQDAGAVFETKNVGKSTVEAEAAAFQAMIDFLNALGGDEPDGQGGGALTPSTFSHLTMEERLAAAGISVDSVTIHTYVYLANDGTVCAIEKFDRHASPADEWDGGEYARKSL